MSHTFALQHLDTPADLRRAFAVMQELRPHLRDVEQFVAQLIRQQERGYRLLAALEGDQVVGLAGYRLAENLLYGRFVYVDDLVVTARLRRTQVGAQLLDGARAQAVEHDCKTFVLDTGLDMALAQRFYFRQGLLARGMHFVQPLQPR